MKRDRERGREGEILNTSRKKPLNNCILVFLNHIKYGEEMQLEYVNTFRGAAQEKKDNEEGGREWVMGGA